MKKITIQVPYTGYKTKKVEAWQPGDILIVTESRNSNETSVIKGDVCFIGDTRISDGTVRYLCLWYCSKRRKFVTDNWQSLDSNEFTVRLLDSVKTIQDFLEEKPS